MHLAALLALFRDREDRSLPTLKYNSTREIPTLSYKWSLKKGTSLGWSLPVLAIIGSTTPPEHRRAVTNITSRASTHLTVILNYDYS